MRASFALALAACAHPSVPASHEPLPWAASGVDWTAAPPVEATPLVVPRLAEFQLRGGTRVLLAENHRLPVVTLITLHAAAGSRDDPPAQPGLAALAVDALDEDPALADALDRAGARLDLAIATDHASAQLVTPARHFDRCVDLLAGVLRRPRLADADVIRIRNEHVAELAQARERPRTVAAQLFDRIVFGAHPYAHAAAGSAGAVAALTAADVRAFHARAYGPATMTIVIAGDVTRDAATRALERAFGDWAAHDATPAPPPRPTAVAPQLAYVDVPGAAETTILIGQLAAPAGSAHQLAADVENAIVGGEAGSRLDRELRDHLAVTVGAGSSYWRGRLAGTWSAAATVRGSATTDAIRAALAVIAHARDTDAPPDELARAKAAISDATAQLFETTVGTARAFERLVAQGLPRDDYATLDARLAALTAADARTAVAWRDLAIVVVGDWAAIGDGARTLGLPIVHYDVDGNRLP